MLQFVRVLKFSYIAINSLWLSDILNLLSLVSIELKLHEILFWIIISYSYWWLYYLVFEFITILLMLSLILIISILTIEYFIINLILVELIQVNLLLLFHTLRLWLRRWVTGVLLIQILDFFATITHKRWIICILLVGKIESFNLIQFARLFDAYLGFSQV